MKRLTVTAACLLALATGATGCITSAKSVMVHRPTDATADAAVTTMWTQEIQGVARDGDWLLSRSYYAVGDVISLVAPGEDLSHASIYDAKRKTVVESIGTGVREIPLADFLNRNHYVIVVRPSNMSAADRAHAVVRARTKVGLPFDIRGMLGIDDPDAWYCSELVYWASQTEARAGASETVVTPADLMKYGEVIYWSGKRDDAGLLAIATDRAERTRIRRTAQR
ncbi:MAG: hypothetical protein H0X17_17535 [Deltaproteobacteria bacterium]|nr:hypothetical protein [Deltaproteobacteria bacterium]